MIIQLDHLSVVEVLGTDPNKFLQGQLTCDTRKLAQQNVLPGILCNLKGQIITLLHVMLFENNFFLLVPKLLANKIITELYHVALLSRVSLNINTQLIPKGKISANNREIFLERSHQQKNDCINTWHVQDILNNHPWICPETTEKFSPFDLSLQNTDYISFEKGCFKGQEILARIKYLAKYKYTYLTVIIPKNDAEIVLGQEYIDTHKKIQGTVIDYCEYSETEYLLAIKS